MGMFRGAAPPQPQNYTGPMQGRQAFGWTPVGQTPVQQQRGFNGLLSGIFGGGIGSRFNPQQVQQPTQVFTGPMQGRQAFGWTPVGQGQVFGGQPAPAPRKQSSGAGSPFSRERVMRAIEQGAYNNLPRRTGDTRSDQLTHTGAKPRDRYNPFDNSPTRPEANPRRGK